MKMTTVSGLPSIDLGTPANRERTLPVGRRISIRYDASSSWTSLVYRIKSKSSESVRIGFGRVCRCPRCPCLPRSTLFSRIRLFWRSFAYSTRFNCAPSLAPKSQHLPSLLYLDFVSFLFFFANKKTFDKLNGTQKKK